MTTEQLLNELWARKCAQLTSELINTQVALNVANERIAKLEEQLTPTNEPKKEPG